MTYYTEIYYVPETNQFITMSVLEEDRQIPVVPESWMLLDGFYEDENFQALSNESVADLVGYEENDLSDEADDSSHWEDQMDAELEAEQNEIDQEAYDYGF